MNFIKKIKEFFFPKYSDSAEGGFTLLETLVAIMILMLMISATFTAIASSMKSGIFSRNLVTANYLAQETLEYVINIRDNFGSAGMSDFIDKCTDSSPCNPNVITDTVSYGNQKIMNGGTNSFWVPYDSLAFSDSKITPFSRNLVVSKVRENEYNIKVTVFWVSGTLNQSVVVNENINEQMRR